MIAVVLFIISCAIQIFILVFILTILFTITNLIFDVIRLVLYKSFKWDWFTNEDKIRLKLIEGNTIAHEVEVLENTSDPENFNADTFWENLNQDLDLQFEPSKFDPDEIMFQGRIKRRRK